MVETSFNVGLNNNQKDMKNLVKYWFANIFKKKGIIPRNTQNSSLSIS